VGLQQGPLSLESTIEELFGRKIRGSGLENREYGRRDPSRLPLGTLYTQNLALISPTSGGRLVGIVRSLTQATKCLLCSVFKKEFYIGIQKLLCGVTKTFILKRRTNYPSFKTLLNQTMPNRYLTRMFKESVLSHFGVLP
jgi:hypothetical protein